MLAPRLISFDLDDTLWDIGAVVSHAERRLHAWFAAHHPAVAAHWSVADLQRLRQEAEARHPELAGDMQALRKASLRRALVEAGADAGLVDPAFEVFWAARHEVVLHADVLPALETLRRRCRLVAITNGNAELERTPVGRYFEFTLTAAGVGHAKPAPEIFHRACARAGVAPADALHVGDDPHYDVEGALGAGLRAVWLNRAGNAWPHRDYRPHHQVRGLDELPGLLD
jgi:putative hydrolase of the HAD superfamily